MSTMMRKIFPFFDQTTMTAGNQESNTWSILPGRLTFKIVDRAPISNAQTDCFTTDHSLVYRPFNNDFGPLNMALLYKFCDLLLAKMHTQEFLHGQKHLVYFSYMTPHVMENAAFLIGSFATLYLNMSPEQCRDQLQNNFNVGFSSYRDAGFQSHSNTINLYDCFCGLVKAQQLNFFNFNLQLSPVLQQLVQQILGRPLNLSSSSSMSSSPNGSPFQENVDFNSGSRSHLLSNSPLKNALGTGVVTASGSISGSSSAMNGSKGSLSVKTSNASLSVGRGTLVDNALNSARTPNPYRLALCAPFDLHRYEYLEDIGNGDMSWLIPGKFLALATPRDQQLDSSPGNNLSPQQVIPILKRENISAVVRLNNRVYERQPFLNAGMKHYDLFFPDCTIPPEHILAKFLRIAEQEPNAMAVHCRAGLGRTGTLIAAYMIKNYKMTAREAIAYIRVCRPGSIIGAQQDFLEQNEQGLLDGTLHLSEDEDAEHAAARLRAEKIETENENGGAKRLLLGNMELQATSNIDGFNKDSYDHLSQQQTLLPALQTGRYQLRSGMGVLGGSGSNSNSNTSALLSSQEGKKSFGNLKVNSLGDHQRMPIQVDSLRALRKVTL